MSTTYYFKTNNLTALRLLGVALGFLTEFPARTNPDGSVTPAFVGSSDPSQIIWRQDVGVSSLTGKTITIQTSLGEMTYPERLPVPGHHCNLLIPQTAEIDPATQQPLKAQLMRAIAATRMADHPEYAEIIAAAQADPSMYFVLDDAGVPVDPQSPQEVFL